MKRIALIGAGGHAKVVWDILQLVADRTGFRVTTVLDDNSDLWGHAFMNLTVDGPTRKIAELGIDGVIIAIGSNRVRGRVYEMIAGLGVSFVNAIHPTAVIARDVQLGYGIVACANIVVNISSRIDNNVILNTGCTIDHDCVVDAHAHIAPGVHLGGGVRVGAGALVGIGSSVIPGRSIGAWTTVGAGSVVIKNIEENVSVAGVPARILERKDSNER